MRYDKDLYLEMVGNWGLSPNGDVDDNEYN